MCSHSNLHVDSSNCLASDSPDSPATDLSMGCWHSVVLFQRGDSLENSICRLLNFRFMLGDGVCVETCPLTWALSPPESPA